MSKDAPEKVLDDFIKAHSESLCADNIIFKMCKLLDGMKGRGFTVDKEKWDRASVPLHIDSGLSERGRGMLVDLNRAEFLAGKELTSPSEVLSGKIPKEMFVYEDAKVRFFEEKNKEGVDTIKVMLVGNVNRGHQEEISGS